MKSKKCLTKNENEQQKTSTTITKFKNNKNYQTLTWANK